jgi:hypothetical protein
MVLFHSVSWRKFSAFMTKSVSYLFSLPGTEIGSRYRLITAVLFSQHFEFLHRRRFDQFGWNRHLTNISVKNRNEFTWAIWSFNDERLTNIVDMHGLAGQHFAG